MNTLASVIRISLITGLLAASPAFLAPALAQENQSEAEKAELRARREALMADIETVRQDAERAAEQARREAERLREEARRLRDEAAMARDESTSERDARRRDMERMRRELSRTHRELRRASQEVARAHRDLTPTEEGRVHAQVINLGDRAMLGVILGRESDQGIAIVGLSPDGPAERAGIETGDILVSLRGVDLGRNGNSSPRERVYEIMSEVSDGEEIPVAVLRDGNRQEYMIKPEKREPASWASYIRLPMPPSAPRALGAPDSPRPATAPPDVRVERIVVPPVDVTRLAAEAEALARELDSFRIRFEGADGDPLDYEYDYEFDPDTFAELGEMGISPARIWLGSPATGGIRFTELNDGLKGYFDADSGVLVLDAPPDNALGLQAGDVVLSIGDDEVGATADIIRALRDFEAGDTFTVAIKRHGKNESLQVVMPENRIGMRHERLIERQGYAPRILGPAED